MAGLAHFGDNEAASSLHSRVDRGLTPFGERVVDRMERLGIAVDLAHVSPRTFDAAIARAKRPVVVSHAGVRATCDSSRNLTDAQLRAIARTGGVVGIGAWRGATCRDDSDGIVRALRHAIRVAGIDHVALGHDFDGAVVLPHDASALGAVPELLARAGFGRAEIEAARGGNAVRVLRELLPD